MSDEKELHFCRVCKIVSKLLIKEIILNLEEKKRVTKMKGILDIFNTTKQTIGTNYYVK